MHSETKSSAPTAPTRRRFLSQAAGVAAGGTVLALAVPAAAATGNAPQPLSANPDPVFGLIEKHKAAEAALEAQLADNGRLEGAGQDYDDSLADAAHEVELSALDDLIEVVPTTLAGVVASMTYIVSLADGSYGRLADDEIVPLLSNLAEALEGLEVAS